MATFHGREWQIFYKIEGTEGAAPTATQYLALAHHAEIRPVLSGNPNAVTQSGSVDKTSFSKGVADTRLFVTFNPSGANGLAFIKNFASTDSSFTLVAKAGSTINTIVGCKVKNIETTGQLYPTATPVQVVAEIWAWSISSTEPTGATYESIPSSFVNWSDTAITLGGSSVSDWWDFSFRIENELERLPNDTGATYTIKRGTRDVTCVITRPVTDDSTSDFNAARDATAKTAIFNFLSSTAVFTLNNGAFTEVETTHPLTGMSGKKISLTASTLTIA